MEIIEMNISDIMPYARNQKKHDKKQIDNVAESIKQFGYVQPVVIDKDNNIIIGHCRVLASKKLKLDKVPCVKLEDLTPEEANKLRLLDNKLNESDWDIDLLVEDIPEMDFTGFDIDWGIKFDSDEQAEVIEDDFNEEVPEEPKAKLGDIYKLGNHRLMCGDSTNVEQILDLLGGERVDMIFTDPPYNVSFNGRSGKFDVIKNDNLTDNEFNDFINETVNVIKAINAPIYYIWCNWDFYGILQSKLDYKSCIVWAKNVFGMGKGYRHQHEFCLFNGRIDENIKNETDLWQIKKDHNYVHPTQKPVELSFRAIGNHSGVQNVLDLFGGSGSTLIGCEQRGVKCFMNELDPKYVDVIIARWEKFTGQKAELLNADR